MFRKLRKIADIFGHDIRYLNDIAGQRGFLAYFSAFFAGVFAVAVLIATVVYFVWY